MKKLVIAAVALAMGFAAQAASVSWKVTGAVGNVGTTVYLFAGSIATRYDTVAALAAASVSSANIAKDGRAYYASATATGDAVTSAANYYFAIVTSDTTFKYLAASGMGDLVYTPPASVPGTFSTTISAISGGSDGKIGKEEGGGGGEAVPEPTSGLLLLVGGALLGLRRRRA